nr:ATPase family AAA domain-containing protein 5 [Nomia melanderi]
MKNITQYLVDTIKSSETTSDNTKQEKESNNGSKKKRNRVKIKISRTNTKERVCDIIESNNDMIDKTPSPFTRKHGKDKSLHEAPRSSTNLQKQTNLKKSETKDLDYLSLETISAYNSKHNKQNDRSNSSDPLRSNKSKKQLKDKESSKSNISLCNTIKNKDAEIVDLVSDNNNEDEYNREESNAFQILMNRKKQIQYNSPTKVPQNDEVNLKNSEEYKTKLKHMKEKLIVLADKKGYSKRKLSEIEEAEKIERIIQNRIKVFKKDEKKDNNLDTTVFTQTQSCGSLLNYFSKVPVNLAHSDITDVSTIIVKADVHMAENSTQCNMYNSSSNNAKQLKRQNKLDMELSQLDTISILESENISTTSKSRKHSQREQNKHRWSLRIKLQSCENRNPISGSNSDEESILPQREINLNAKNSKNSGIKSVGPKELSMKDKNPRRTQKQINEQKKLEFTKHELSKNTEDMLISMDNKNSDECINSNLEDCIFIDESKLKRKTADKLAPLFTKRQKPDPEILAARRLFLQPDITDKNKGVDRKVNANSILLFPVVSHITQLSNLSYNEMSNFNIPKKSHIKYIPTINVNNYKCIVDFSEIKLRSSKNKKLKVQEVLSEIEKFCPGVRKMWSTISLIFEGQFNKIVSPKTKTKRIKSLQKGKVLEEKNIENQSESNIWTYKYRPKSIEEIVGNEEPAMKLKEWLIGWKTTFSNEDSSSGDEFYSSDSNSSRVHENNQVAILLGPHGCGKTASVYAVAEEFGYIVLEVNASSRRSGKILFKELEEATKSHHIKKNTNTSRFLNLISDEIVPKKIPQNSLILIEDIDLVFEEDEGFISATYQLALNTKRPIVMTCRDICPHLSKIAPQQNRIYFQHANGNRVIALLQLISLAETGYNIPTNFLKELVQIGDLRNAILKLQYLMLSNPTQIFEQSIIFQKSFWQNMRHYLYKPAIKANKKQTAKKAANSKETNCNKHILDDIANKLNNIVVLSHLIDLEDSALNLSQTRVQPSLSLIENIASYSASDNICLDIAEWISEKVLYNSRLSGYDGTSSYYNAIELKKQLNKGINSALSHTTSTLLDHQVLSTDYLPCLRTICRAEESRANVNNKRRNRFFHYLHSLKVPSMSLKPNILTAACRIMHDTLDNNTSTNESNTLISQ